MNEMTTYECVDCQSSALTAMNCMQCGKPMQAVIWVRKEAAQPSVQRTGYQTAIIPCPHCGVNVTIDSDSFIASR